MPDTIVTERLVPVAVPSDSALLTALLECDSNRRVILASYRELKSRGVESSLSLDSGRLNYNVRTRPDTVRVATPQRTVYVPVEQPPLTEYVNRLTWWQQTCIYAGYALYALVLWKVIRKLLKRRSNGK